MQIDSQRDIKIALIIIFVFILAFGVSNLAGGLVSVLHPIFGTGFVLAYP